MRPRPTALDPYKPLIDDMLRTDLDAPRKERHTFTRIFHRLVVEHGADVSYQMVRRYVSDRKPEILAASGKAPVEAFVPQTHLPGHEAEVDFGDVTVRLAGELETGSDSYRPAPHQSPPTGHRSLLNGPASGFGGASGPFVDNPRRWQHDRPSAVSGKVRRLPPDRFKESLGTLLQSLVERSC